MTIDQQLFELMLKAPACPESWEPDMGGFTKPIEPDGAPETDSITGATPHPAWRAYFKEKAIYQSLFDAQRLAQWPSAYARMVMEAGSRGGKE